MQKSILVTREFELFISASNSGRRQISFGRKISKGTILQYRCVHRLLQDFELTQKERLRIIPLNRCSLRIIQKEKKYWKLIFKKFFNYLYHEKKYYDNYVSSVFRIIKAFFRYLTLDKSIVTGDFYKSLRVPAENFSPAILTPKQLKFLICDINFENSLTQSLKRTKDIFVFGCTVGLRYKDLLNLKYTNLQVIDGEHFLNINTQKTGAEVRIGLPDYAISIIKKYKPISGGYILPRLSNTNLNLQVKDLIRKAGWDYYMPKIRHRQGMSVEIKNKKGVSFRFYHHITTHTMRRTAITSLLMLGLEEHIVRKISGHTPGSKEFYRYVNISQDYLSTKLKMIHKKLIEA